MPSVHDRGPPSPPRAPTIKYSAPHGTRWDKEKAAAGGAHAFDLPSDPKVLGPWIIGECVGKGASGRVKIAKHRYTNQLAAVKILPRAPLDSSRNSIATQEAKSKKHSLGIEREITMMKLMNHPNILRIYDVYEGPKELFLVLEYVEGGELFDYLVNRGRLPEPDAICFFKQIIYGLNYAHTFSIIHRDLKPENILISSLSPPRIKIVDWGMAAFAPPSLQLETSCGSPHYASPEIVNGYKYTGNATDIWSCGVILYALLTGRLPFDDKDVKVLLGKVKVGKYDMPSYIDRSAQDLLSKMLVINVKERITIPEILAHPWLTTSPAALRQLSLASSFESDSQLEPVLPPSPSTLAQPISNPSSIDSDILFSLKVIWGRHADRAAILKDLGSAAGNGVHTKAFYWLLRRHHEEAERLAGLDDSSNESTSGIGMGPGSVTFNLGWELDTSGLGDVAANNFLPGRTIEVGHFRGPERRALADASRSLQTADGLLSPLMTRNASSPTFPHSSRSRPNSPGGPRMPSVPRPTYERNSSQLSTNTTSTSGKSSSHPKSSFAMGNGGGARANSVINGIHGGPRPQPPKRGHTYSHPRSEKISHASAVPSRSDSSSNVISVSTVQFPPAPAHPIQYTQSHRSVSRSSRPRSSTTANVTIDKETRFCARPHSQARPHSHTSQGRGGYAGGTSLKRVISLVHSETDNSSGSSTACGITSTATVHAPIPMRVVSGIFEVPMEVDDDSATHIVSTPPPVLPPLLQPLPLLTAPKMNDSALQVELDGLAEHVNRLSLQDALAETNVGRDLQIQSQEHHSHALTQTRQASYQQQRFQSPKRTRRQTLSTVERGAKNTDKENKENTGMGDESWSYIVPDDGSNVVTGKNALFVGTGNHKRSLTANDGKGKKLKDKKPRPPPLEFQPLNHKRSTISALGSPIALSPPTMNSSSTKAGLGSPVVGEFKGWLSSLFSWSGKNTPGNILYSIDDITKTRRDLLHLLTSLGVIIEIHLSDPGVEGDDSPLRCRIEESSDALAHLGMKPVKFRIEFTLIGDEAGSGMFPSSPITPLSNGYHLFPTASAPGVRGRSSTLGCSSHLPLCPLLSPNVVAVPNNFLSAIIMIQEKGSTSTFKAIWKKLKDVYDDGCGEIFNSNFSPVMTSTPVVESPRYVV